MELPSFLSHPVWFFCSVVLAVVLRLQRKGSWEARKCRADLTGKTAIVTGANTGIGKQVALDFARRNARVILACRSRDRGQKAVDEIKRETSNRNVILSILDTSSMASVRSFAEQILKEEKRLDILVNNAGASGLPYAITPEGLEITFTTNHLGPFLLTHLLLDLLKRTAPSRIVVVSSFMHGQGNIDTSNLWGKNLEKNRYNDSYNSTKLMNAIWAKDLATQLQGTGVTVNSVNPGIVMTDAMRNYPFLLRFIFNIIGFFFFKNAEEGAASAIYSSVSEEAEGLTGKFIDSDCTIVPPSKKTRDPAVNRKLWEACESATNLNSHQGK
ncbi:retinol dehydrogenase 14-like isoform X2 [Bufo bufo]|uniref:retinol dehydrogenase 14-like isoform X1 n=1 Tax=Bufo bufo TaxID=8384 RepID=UPI001ABDBA4F|nr:retinol dehydrogenase 14-like isoform X1 [Bufo bufo]XP_040275390.1 retinol dehydrogenase 14-like isoform X2 [Bufo bufo]